MTNDLQEPRVDDLGGEGWAGLKALDQKMANTPDVAPDEHRRIAQVAASVFATEGGRQVLEWLVEQTMRRSSVPNFDLEGLLVEPKKLASYALWSEAQKALVLRLIALIKAGEKSPQ